MSENTWEIIDEKGALYQGTEDEMNAIFNRILSGEKVAKWIGDLKLIEVLPERARLSRIFKGGDKTTTECPDLAPHFHQVVVKELEKFGNKELLEEWKDGDMVGVKTIIYDIRQLMDVLEDAIKAELFDNLC